ncbi:DUF6076 domain-containing protein [uncultured Oscillibacter sp.]|uniref:DUF6076 domain-containing protein n=1 Tax=uncultured Oscillibacter sp. TaxID=876091 RepID=UPI00260B9C0F|nr:DUF6076 domain-containing protein [uncultured Oscillibacter sp.]
MAENTFDRFSVFFTGDTVFLDGTVFPLGQLTTEVLNIDSKILTEIDRRVNHFMSAVWALLQEKTDSAARSAQERLNAVWDLVFDLPVYRSLRLDTETARSLFPDLLFDRTKWPEVLDVDSESHRMFEEFLSGLEYFAESLRNFRGQLEGMLELYFEPLSRRSNEAYAEAYAAYFTDMAAAGELFFPEQEFSQSFPVQLCFVPMAHPMEAGKTLLAEKVEFHYLSHFLYTDFYRGLMAGNAPRRCHNCGRYFLLTAGYNTCYCNNIAPGETERTCRKVGAHRKANHPTGLSPAGVEYRKVYNRLKARKQRGKISRDEWNATLSQVQEVLDLAEQGKLTDEEMRKLFATF